MKKALCEFRGSHIFIDTCAFTWTCSVCGTTANEFLDEFELDQVDIDTHGRGRATIRKKITWDELYQWLEEMRALKKKQKE